MATSISSSTIGIERQYTNRSPLFNGTNYQLSNQMSIYMRSYDYEIWDVVMDGLYILMKKKKNDEMKPKPRSEWTDAKMKKNSNQLQGCQHPSLCSKSYRV